MVKQFVLFISLELYILACLFLLYKKTKRTKINVYFSKDCKKEKNACSLSRFGDAHKAKALSHTPLSSSVGEGCSGVLSVEEISREEADRLMREMTRVKSSA